MFRSDNIKHISDHTFLVIEWNIMERAENCVEAKIEHISFYWDTLMFDFANTKTDQEGIKNIDHPWHVYKNPLEPVVFPLLSLARYIISRP